MYFLGFKGIKISNKIHFGPYTHVKVFVKYLDLLKALPFLLPNHICNM